MSSPVSSLRERSKARRRVAIQRAALHLFAERGYDGATIAEIADAAEVAPRSVSAYFPSKLDIALSTSSDIADRLTAAFRANPEGAFVEVVDQWLAGEADATDPELAALTVAMFDANPDLRAVAAGHFTEAARMGGEALLAQVELDADDPMHAVVIAAVSAAISARLSAAIQAEPSPDTHRRFIGYLSAIISAAQPARH